MIKHLNFLSFCVFSLLIFMACNSTKPLTETNEEKLELQNIYSELVDLLRNKPGLRIQGNGSNVQVILRGEKSLLGSNEPLFVLDGTIIGNTYQQASQGIDPNSIARVKILTPANAGIYGSRGGNGVIELFSKK